MSAIDRARAAALEQLRARGQTVLGTVKAGIGMRAVGLGVEAIGKVTDLQSQVLSKSLGAINAGPVLGNIAQQLGVPLPQATALADQLGLPAAGPRIEALSASLAGRATAAPSSLGRDASAWTPSGAIAAQSIKARHDDFRASAMIAKAWKHLFYVEITDWATSETAPRGLGDDFNLLATDVSFGPSTIAGEAVPIGSAVMDSITGTERVDLRISTMDDARGSVQRWFDAKCAQVARQDGTFGLPVDYVVVVRIVQMDPIGAETKANRLHRAWLMRPVSIQVDLSRRDATLQEVEMNFTQYDTAVDNL